jgi:hypothetical protein
MKDFIPEIQDKDGVTIQDQTPVLKEKKLLGSVQKKNVPLWELDIMSGVVKLCDIKSIAELGGAVKHSVDVKEKTLYIQSLNEKNAIRKFKNMIRDIVSKNYGLNCTDAEWNIIKFEGTVILLRNLWK